VDALYLQLDDEFCTDNMAVTHGDIRLFIPPDMIGGEDNGDNGNGDIPEYNQFDADEDGVISGTELSNAIDAYYDGAISGSELSEIIDYYYLGGAGYL
jgi:hypothetical protein